MKRLAVWRVVDFEMYRNATQRMARDDAKMSAGTNRRMLRGNGSDTPVIAHLRLVYDRDAQDALPDDFKDLLAKLD